MGRRSSRVMLTAAVALLLAGAAVAREMTSVYVVTAAANTTGVAGTDWHTDLTLYNPQSDSLPVVLQFLPSGRDNGSGVPTVEIELAAWETLNLWDVLGPHGFDARGTGALLVYADDQHISCQGTGCDFAVFARTYTLNPSGGAGEFGQAVPGFPASLGLDSTVLAYMPQLSDDGDFRTNVGMASWTPAWVTVRFDLQNAAGDVIDSREHHVPPYGHVQWRLEEGVTGGTVAAYVTDGPSSAIVYPYASVVNWVTGDAVNVEAHMSVVGFTAPAAPRPPQVFPARLTVPSFSRARLCQPPTYRTRSEVPPR